MTYTVGLGLEVTLCNNNKKVSHLNTNLKWPDQRKLFISQTKLSLRTKPFVKADFWFIFIYIKKTLVYTQIFHPFKNTMDLKMNSTNSRWSVSSVHCALFNVSLTTYAPVHKREFPASTDWARKFRSSLWKEQ